MSLSAFSIASIAAIASMSSMSFPAGFRRPLLCSGFYPIHHLHTAMNASRLRITTYAPPCLLTFASKAR